MFLKKLIASLLASLFILSAIAQDQYTKGELINILEEKDIKVKTYNISVKYDAPELLLVTDKEERDFFAVIASKQYSGFLKSPVLAYGKSKVEGTINNTFMSILTAYRRMLIDLSQECDSVCFSNVSGRVEPMMENIHWGQKAPYNDLFPTLSDGINSRRAVTGCGPLALGQVLKYLEHPAAADSSQLLYTLAVEMEAKMEIHNTSTNSKSFRSVLVESYNISPKCKLIDVSSIRELPLVYSEVREKRPVILSGHNHFFICDGFDSEYLHLNFGWYGNWDGWYQAPCFTGQDETTQLFKSLLCGVEIDMHPGFSKTVNVKTPGTLEEMLTEYEKANLHNLAVVGRINGKDIKFLRRMSGEVDDCYFTSWRGSLQHLDLSEARIIADNETPYYTSDARKTRFYVYRDETTPDYGPKHYEFHFENITDEEWMAVKKYNMHIGSNYRVRKEGEDYFVDYYTNRNTIGPYMFAGCINLMSIALPEKIQSVERYAFHNTSLKVMPSAGQ